MHPSLLLTAIMAAAAPLTTDSGARGSVLLEDFTLIEKLARFDRERTPERVVHARGVGAYGTFESAGDFSALTRAKIFSAKGKRTPMFVRFSTVVHGGNSPETLRDPRGFALSSIPRKATGTWSATTCRCSSSGMRSSSPTWSTRSSRRR